MSLHCAAQLTGRRSNCADTLIVNDDAIEASRALAYQVIDDRVKDRPNGAIVNVARVAMVRAERAVAEVALTLLGGGSTEVQLNLIARALFYRKES
jgi:alkylation response protein AidB-like acyl-CoA dehydrogenase